MKEIGSRGSLRGLQLLVIPFVAAALMASCSGDKPRDEASYQYGYDTTSQFAQDLLNAIAGTNADMGPDSNRMTSVEDACRSAAEGNMLGHVEKDVVAGCIAAFAGASGGNAAVTSPQASPSTSSRPSTSAMPAPALSGTYSAVFDRGPARRWVVSSCGLANCVNIETGSTLRGRAYLSSGSWRIQVWRPNAIACPNGDVTSGLTFVSWDSTTLRGTLQSESDQAGCLGPGGTRGSLEPFTLKKLS